MTTQNSIPTENEVADLLNAYNALRATCPCKFGNTIECRDALSAWSAASVACSEAARIERNNSGRARVNAFEAGSSRFE